MNIRSTLALATFVLFFACTSPRSKLPDIANIYKEAALDEIRNPVVVLHGVLGARLVDHENGKTVAVAESCTDLCARAQALRLPRAT